MIHLILTIISLVLVTATITLTITHIPLSAYEQARMISQTQEGFTSLSSATVRYLNAHRDLEGFIIFPGDAVDMVPLITPDYGFVPAKVLNSFGWQAQSGYYKGLQAVGICLSPLVGAKVDPELVNLLPNIQSRLPEESSVLANSCFTQTDEGGGNSLTHWVILNHLEKN